jgi:hypothetical protein
MGRAEEVDAELEAAYALVPEIDCKGLCTDACGPIDGGLREMVRLARAGVRIPPRREALLQLASDPEGYSCPALVDERCSVYALRPMVCRIWGAVENLRCPYGCVPRQGAPLLASAEAMALLDAAESAGTSRAPKPVEFYEKRLAQPGVREVVDNLVPRPVATRKLPRA